MAIDLENSLAIVPGDRFVWDQNGEVVTVIELTTGGYWFLCLVGEDGEVWRYTYSWLIACQRLSPLSCDDLRAIYRQNKEKYDN